VLIAWVIYIYIYIYICLLPSSVTYCSLTAERTLRYPPYVRRTKKTHPFFFSDLYCLRHVSSNEAFIIRKTVHAGLWYFILQLYKQSGAAFLPMNTQLFETFRRNYSWIKSLKRKVCIFLVPLTHVYHDARFRKRKKSYPTSFDVCIHYQFKNVSPRGKLYN
jgi:hypothetical protein